MNQKDDNQGACASLKAELSPTLARQGEGDPTSELLDLIDTAQDVADSHRDFLDLVWREHRTHIVFTQIRRAAWWPPDPEENSPGLLVTPDVHQAMQLLDRVTIESHRSTAPLE